MLRNLGLLTVLILGIPVILLVDIVTLGGTLNDCTHSYWWRHKKEIGKVFKRLF